MEQFRAGDELALRESFNHYGGMMQRVGMLCAGNDQEADDLLRRVFVRARRGRDGFTPDSGSLGSWLLGITHRLIADEYPDRGP